MQDANHNVQETPLQRSKTLVAGWFSFERGHATAGDLLAGDLACEWLEQAGCSYDVALAPPFHGGVDWRSADPQSYSNVVFVCGPFANGKLESEFLGRFSNCNVVGLSLSMIEPLDVWNPFDTLLERDSSVGVRPDIVYLSHQARVPIVGVILVEPYKAGTTQVTNAAIHQLVNAREMSTVAIDTRLDVNSTGLRSSAEIESLIARMDVVITTRMHGMVLALKNGVPAIAIDPEVGGAKVRRQAEEVGWPVVFNVDDLTDEALQEAFDYCLTDDARAKVRECYQQATKTLQEVHDQFVSVLRYSEESQRIKAVDGRRWLRDQWQGNKDQVFQGHSLWQLSELEHTLVEERKNVRRLRERNQLLKKQAHHLKKRAHRLKQRLRNVQNSRIQRLLKRLGRVRSMILKGRRRG